MADGGNLTAGAGLVVSTGILGDLVLPRARSMPPEPTRSVSLPPRPPSTPPRPAGRARCAPTAPLGASTTRGACVIRAEAADQDLGDLASRNDAIAGIAGMACIAL